MTSHPPQNNPGSNAPPASLLPLLQQAAISRLQMNSASGRSNNEQNGNRSAVSGTNSALPQPSWQMSNMSGNNNGGGNDSSSLALFGNLAKLVELQGLLGNNNNNNNNNNGLGYAQSIEQQLRSLGIPVSQQQISALLSSSGGHHKTWDQRSASSSLSQAMQSGGDSGEDNMSSRFSFSPRNLIGDSSSMQSNSVKTQRKNVVAVPCRARGMPMEHNFQTACFEIPEHIKHGDGLICSFPQCRNRGIKFLYCAYCKDPVAKRNFRDRHTHNDQAANTQTKNKPQPAQRVAKGMTKSKTTSQHEVSEGTGSNTGSGSSSGILVVAPKHHHNKKRSAVNFTNTSSDDVSRSKLARMDGERKDAWVTLLGKRPDTDQSDAMSAWLMKVMAVSDLKKSTAEALAKLKDISPKSSSPEPGSSGSSNEDSNEESSPTDESSPPTESNSSPNDADGAVKGAKKMPSSAPTSSNDASNEDSSPTNSNESSNDSSSDNQDDMDIREIWIRD